MRILLYGDWPLALTYLDPLARYIEDNEPSWVVGYGGDIGREVDEFPNPDVVITCDELSAAPYAPLKICIFHGLASKGQAFSTARRQAFVGGHQVFAVPGPYYKKLLLDMEVPRERIFISGLTKFDNYQRKILYAPTHNSKLSAIPVLQNRIYEIPNVTVHLHQWTRVGDKPHHQLFRSYHPVHEDREDIWDLLLTHDVIIGDCGSIVVEAIALGKQAIQVVNPKHLEWYRRVKGLDDKEIYALPEIALPTLYATRVHSFAELKKALGVVSYLGSASERIVQWIKEKS